MKILGWIVMILFVITIVYWLYIMFNYFSNRNKRQYDKLIDNEIQKIISKWEIPKDINTLYLYKIMEIVENTNKYIKDIHLLIFLYIFVLVLYFFIMILLPYLGIYLLVN